MTDANEMTLREVTKDTLDRILRVKTTPEQERFVANNAVSIADAHFSEEAWFRGIWAGDEAVGFVMLAIYTEKPEYWVWRFLIGAEHQGKGYGKRAMELIAGHVRTLPDAEVLYLSYVPGEGCPGPFYEKLGFEHTGEKEGDELVMKLEL